LIAFLAAISTNPVGTIKLFENKVTGSVEKETYFNVFLPGSSLPYSLFPEERAPHTIQYIPLKT